MQAAKKIL